MTFNEAVLEQAIIDKFKEEGYQYVSGDDLHRELTDVLIEDDLKSFLLSKYADNRITVDEVQNIINSVKSASALPVYDANKRMLIAWLREKSLLELIERKRIFYYS